MANGESEAHVQHRAPTAKQNTLMRIGEWMWRIEDVIYIGIALLLATGAIGILISIVVEFVTRQESNRPIVLEMLDRLLLVLMLVEILHTVGISLREHILLSESFLTVGLIAAIRRVLVITAEQPEASETQSEAFQLVMMELGLLTLLILTLVVAIYLLRKRTATRSEQVEPGTEPGTYILRRSDGSRVILAPQEDKNEGEQQS